MGGTDAVGGFSERDGIGVGFYALYLTTKGCGGVGVCSVPCNRKVAGLNLPRAAA